MRLIIFIIKIFLLSWFTFWESTFYHELGHFIIAKKYDKSVYGKIILKHSTPAFKIKNCVYVQDENLSSRGRTDLSNNYIVYTDSQLRKIAISGACLGAASIVAFGIAIEILFCSVISLYERINNSFYMQLQSTNNFLIITLLISIIWSYGNFLLSNDYWIFKNPGLYRKQCKALAKRL